MINIRQKGFDAERQIADHLNTVVNGCYMALGLALPTKPIIQRNQNQSAVGGKDLIGTFGLAIEVKRQEQLSINTWWRQCEASANALNEIPVLIFRQNRQPWRCITNGSLQCEGSAVHVIARCEIGFDDFTSWFRQRVLCALQRDLSGRGHQTEGLFA